MKLADLVACAIKVHRFLEDYGDRVPSSQHLFAGRAAVALHLQSLSDKLAHRSLPACPPVELFLHRERDDALSVLVSVGRLTLMDAVFHRMARAAGFSSQEGRGNYGGLVFDVHLSPLIQFSVEFVEDEELYVGTARSYADIADVYGGRTVQVPTTVLVAVLAKAVDAWLMRLARNESAPPRLLEKLRTLAYAQSFVERLGPRGLLGLGATAWARRMPFLVHEDKYRATATLLLRLMPVSVARMAEANTLEEGYPLGTPAFALTQGEWAAALGLIIARYHDRIPWEA